MCTSTAVANKACDFLLYLVNTFSSAVRELAVVFFSMSERHNYEKLDCQFLVSVSVLMSSNSREF